ncbi:MAG TPA: hypothetical protein VFV50_18010 [Bdellovibrionales bacterium]|nr:hypothetical protein [Bdellovibrionales bacterium]
MQRSICLILLALISGAAARAGAEPLTNLALYHRCYTQLTQKRAPAGDALTIAVGAGSRSAVSACLEVLDRARFTQLNRTQIVATDATGVNVLQTIHKLHLSWFTNKDIVDIDNANPTRDIYDTGDTALYFTRAVFGDAVRFDTIVTSNDTLRSIRSDDNLTRGPSSNQDRSLSLFGALPEFKFAGKGDLLGFEIAGLRTLSYSYMLGGTTTRAGSVSLGQHYGGGILGHPVYLLANVQQANDFRADGALLVPRKFARAIFSDLMCREIPVVRDADVGEFVVPASTVSFRNSSSCVRCHATIDRASAVIRGFSYDAPGNNEVMNLGVNVPKFTPPALAAETGWPSEPDRDYYRRPANGVLYYRNFNGELVNLAVTSLQDLGVKLAQQEDLHVCMAKRYYRYFTGIDVPLSDPGDPAAPPLTAADSAHRAQVIALGRSLKSHQSVRMLIEEILTLPIYRESNFGVTPN